MLRSREPVSGVNRGDVRTLGLNVQEPPPPIAVAGTLGDEDVEHVVLDEECAELVDVTGSPSTLEPLVKLNDSRQSVERHHCSVFDERVETNAGALSSTFFTAFDVWCMSIGA